MRRAIKACGRVSRDEVIAWYRKSHFSVIIRENARYAKAGFPTKSVESWAHGLPVITNGIGDFRSYCHPMNFILIDDSDDFYTSFEKAINSLSPMSYKNMSLASFDTACQYFSYKRFVKDIVGVLEG